MFSLIESLPLLNDQASSEFAYILDSRDRLSVAYEAKRDFLSAPRCFILLEFSLIGAVYSGGEGLDDGQWQSLQGLPWGIYSIPCEEQIDRPQALNYLFYSANFIFNFVAVLEKGSMQKRYHIHSAREALMQTAWPNNNDQA